MCQECGCGLGVDLATPNPTHHHHTPNPLPPHTHTHDPTLTHSYTPTGERDQEHKHEQEVGNDHGHHHHHDHQHQVVAPALAPDHPANAPQVVAIQRSLLERNVRHAEQNRGFFRAKKVLVLNVMSAPGSGKTTLIQQTAEALRGQLRVGVITGDLATENDAQRLREAGVPVVPITTGTLCHLEADMVSRSLDQLDLDALEVLIIENVGNLVCPAAYDLGEHLRVVLLSVTEGEDKPLKYPPLFHSAQVAVLTKSDMAEAAGFEREAALANLGRISHHAVVMELSARTGQGMDHWIGFVQEQFEQLVSPQPKTTPARRNS